MKAPILPAGLEEVSRWYRMPEREKVEDFLGAHPEILPVLLNAALPGKAIRTEGCGGAADSI